RAPASFALTLSVRSWAWAAPFLWRPISRLVGMCAPIWWQRTRAETPLCADIAGRDLIGRIMVGRACVMPAQRHGAARSGHCQKRLRHATLENADVSGSQRPPALIAGFTLGSVQGPA